MNTLQEFTNFTRGGGWKKLATQQQIDDHQLELSFMQMAKGQVESKARKLFTSDRILGFEVIKKIGTDPHRMIGMFAADGGGHLILIPCFMNEGRVVGVDSLYSDKLKFMLPLTTEFIDYVIGSDTADDGDAHEQSDTNKIPKHIRFNDMASPRGAFNNKMACALFEDMVKHAEAVLTEDDKPDAIYKFAKKAGTRILDRLEACVSENPYVFEALNQTLDMDLLIKSANEGQAERMEKSAVAQPGTVVAHYGRFNKQASDATMQLMDGLTLQDTRKEDEKTTVYADVVDPCDSWGSFEGPGMYKVLGTDGESRTCLVVQADRRGLSGYYEEESTPGIYASGPESVREAVNKAERKTLLIYDTEDKRCSAVEYRSCDSNNVCMKPVSLVSDAKSGLFEPYEDATTGNTYIVLDLDQGSYYGDSYECNVLKSKDTEGTGDDQVVLLEFKTKEGAEGLATASDSSSALHVVLNPAAGESSGIQSGTVYARPGRVLFLEVNPGSGDSDYCGDSGYYGHEAAAGGAGLSFGLVKDFNTVIQHLIESRPPGLELGKESDLEEHGIDSDALGFRVKTAGLNPTPYLNAVGACLQTIKQTHCSEEDAAALVKHAYDHGSVRFWTPKPADMRKAASQRQLNMTGLPHFYTDTDSDFGTLFEEPQSEMIVAQVRDENMPEPRVGDRVDLNKSMDPIMSSNQLVQMYKDTGGPVIEQGAMGTLVDTYDALEALEGFIPDLMKGLDRLGRVLFLIHYRPEDFIAAFGSDDRSSYEQKTKAAYQTLGEMITETIQRNKDLDYVDKVRET